MRVPLRSDRFFPRLAALAAAAALPFLLAACDDEKDAIDPRLKALWWNNSPANPGDYDQDGYGSFGFGMRISSSGDWYEAECKKNTLVELPEKIIGTIDSTKDDRVINMTTFDGDQVKIGYDIRGGLLYLGSVSVDDVDRGYGFYGYKPGLADRYHYGGYGGYGGYNSGVGGYSFRSEKKGALCGAKQPVADEFEDDNSIALAAGKSISFDESQARTFHQTDDLDYAQFTSGGAGSYTFQVTPMDCVRGGFNIITTGGDVVESNDYNDYDYYHYDNGDNRSFGAYVYSYYYDDEEAEDTRHPDYHCDERRPSEVTVNLAGSTTYYVRLFARMKGFYELEVFQ